jgi:hypothetical protein
METLETYLCDPKTDEQFKLLSKLEKSQLQENAAKAFALPKTFDDYLRVNVCFIQGRLYASNYHHGPIFDQDIDGLVTLHEKHRIFTHCGQSGDEFVDDSGNTFEQRAYLTLICEEDTLKKIKTIFGCDTKYVYQWMQIIPKNSSSSAPQGGTCSSAPQGGTIQNEPGLMHCDDCLLYPVTRTIKFDGAITNEGFTSLPLFSTVDYDPICSGISSELGEEMRSGKYYKIDIASRAWRGGDVIGELVKKL